MAGSVNLGALPPVNLGIENYIGEDDLDGAIEFNETISSTYKELNRLWLAGDANFRQQLDAAVSEQRFPFDYGSIELGYKVMLMGERELVKKDATSFLFKYRSCVFDDSAWKQQMDLRTTGNKSSQAVEGVEVLELNLFVEYYIMITLSESKYNKPILKLEPQEIIKGVVWLAHTYRNGAQYLAERLKSFSFMEDELKKYLDFEGQIEDICIQQADHGART